MILFMTYMDMFFAYAMPSSEVAGIVGILVNSVLLLFMGFSPPADAIPSGYTWLYKITPQRFQMSILASLVFCDCSDEPIWNATLGKYVGGGSDLGCQPLSNAPVTVGHITVKEFVEEVFGFKHHTISDYFLVSIGYVILFRILGLLALRYVNHQKR